MGNERVRLMQGRAMTRADLEQMPDNGRRYELIDGLLIASPAPSRLHQRAVANLFFAVNHSCPIAYEALFAPLGVSFSEDTVIQPDLVVAHRADDPDRVVPILAIEVVSPTTRDHDLLLKKERLERAGCQHYWTFDPDTRTMTAWSLDAGTYIQTVTATGDEPFNVDQPYPITLTPSALIAG